MISWSPRPLNEAVNETYDRIQLVPGVNLCTAPFCTHSISRTQWNNSTWNCHNGYRWWRPSWAELARPPDLPPLYICTHITSAYYFTMASWTLTVSSHQQLPHCTLRHLTLRTASLGENSTCTLVRSGELSNILLLNVWGESVLSVINGSQLVLWKVRLNWESGGCETGAFQN
jgi:hypothetical protein